MAAAAKNLWNTVARKSVSTVSPDTTAQPALSPEAQAVAALETRLVAMEAAFSDLHNQMLASSELIKALAEQNAQLIKGIEVNRVRVLWLTAAIAVVAIAAVISLASTPIYS